MIAKSKPLGVLFGLLLILSAFIIFTPNLKSGLFMIILVLLYTIIIFFNVRKKCYQKHPRLLFFVCLYLLMCIAYKLFGISSASFGAIVVHFFFFIFLLLMIIVPHNLTLKQSQIVFYVAIFAVLLNILDNIRLCLTYPEIYALVNRGMDPNAANLNFGGSKFYNAIFFFFTICLFGYLNCEKKKMKYILLISTAIAGVFIFAFCLKASVIVFTMLSAFLLFFAKRSKSVVVFSFRIFIPALVVFGLANIFSDVIIEVLSQIFSSDRLVQRLAFMVDSESSSTGAGTVEARENLWLLSLNTWTDSLTNFIFGIGDHRADWAAGEAAVKTGIGQHSEFIDSFARYGVMGVFLLFNILYLSLKYLLSLFGDEYKLQLLVIILLFSLFGLTKAAFQPDISFILFIFLPLMSNSLNLNNSYNDLDPDCDDCESK